MGCGEQAGDRLDQPDSGVGPTLILRPRHMQLQKILGFLYTSACRYFMARAAHQGVVTWLGGRRIQGARTYSGAKENASALSTGWQAATGPSARRKLAEPPSSGLLNEAATTRVWPGLIRSG